MKFKSEDFCFDMEDHDAGLKYLAHVASHMANARLEQMLAEAPATLIEKTETLREAYDTAMKNWDMCATVSRQRQEEIANLNGALGTDRRRIDSLKEEVWRLQKSHDQIATDCKLVREENAALKAAVERWQEVVVAIEKMDGSKLNSQNYPLAVGSSWALLHMENQALRDKLDAKVNEAIDFCEKADDRKKENQSLRELLRDIQATCGHPDAAEGCRIILKRIDAALADPDEKREFLKRNKAQWRSLRKPYAWRQPPPEIVRIAREQKIYGPGTCNGDIFRALARLLRGMEQ